MTTQAGTQATGEGPDVVVTGGNTYQEPVAGEGVSSFAAFEAQMQAEAAAAVAEGGVVKAEEPPPVKKAEGTAEAGDQEAEAATAAEAEPAAGDGKPEVPDDAGVVDPNAGPKTELSKGQQKKLDRVAAQARRTAEAEARTAREEAAALRAENERLKAGKATTEDTGLAEGEPDPEKYPYGELDPAYRRDVRAWDKAELLKTLKADQQASAATAKAAETKQKFEGQVDAILEEHLDYYEVVEDGLKDGKWTLPKAFDGLLMESAVGAKIAYHLATNPSEAKRIADLSEHRQAVEFGKLEMQLEGKAPAAKPAQTARVSKADPPVETVRGSSGKFAASSATTDFAAFEKHYSHLIER